MDSVTPNVANRAAHHFARAVVSELGKRQPMTTPEVAVADAVFEHLVDECLGDRVTIIVLQDLYRRLIGERVPGGDEAKDEV